METKLPDFQTWDDVVFENRNRSYGAYAIRKAYSRRVMLGSGMSIALFALLLVIAGRAVDSTKPLARPIPDPKWLDFTRQPVIEPNRPAKKKEKSVPASRTDTQVKVVTTPVEESKQEPQTTSVAEPEGETGEGIDGPVSGELNGSSVILPDTRPEGPVVYAEVMPVFPGGDEAMMKFIRKHIRYPRSAQDARVSGTVFVSFVVDGDGKVVDVSVIRGIHPACDREAVRVIRKLPGWRGGTQNGRPVAVKMVLPIRFDLL